MSEILLNHELSINKDARKAYGMQIACTNVMRMFRDLPMHVILCKMSKENNDGVWFFQPKMIGTKLGQSIPYFFDEVLALRHGQTDAKDSQYTLDGYNRYW